MMSAAELSIGKNVHIHCRGIWKYCVPDIMEMRISYACKLLSWTDMSVGQIAYECGYDNMAHFDRCFKTVTSQTPSAYQKKFVRIRKSM